MSPRSLVVAGGLLLAYVGLADAQVIKGVIQVTGGEMP